MAEEDGSDERGEDGEREVEDFVSAQFTLGERAEIGDLLFVFRRMGRREASSRLPRTRGEV